MRKSLRVAAAAIVLLTGCSRLFKGPFNWQTFTAPDGSFSVDLPGPLKKETRQQGPLTITMYGAEVRNGIFAAAVCDLPPGAPFDYDGGVRGIAASHAGKILTQSPWNIAGHVGRAFEIELTQPKGYASGRMVVVNGRLYQLLVMGAHFRESDAEVQKFFGSFRLNARVAALPPPQPIQDEPAERPRREPGRPGGPEPRTVEAFEQPDVLPASPFASDPALAAGGAKVFLSDLGEFGWKAGPQMWSFGKNGSVGNGWNRGATIEVDGVAYPKGLGMHPPDNTFTRVCYALGKRAKSLHGAVGIAEDELVPPQPVRFLVLGDGNMLWRSDSIRALKVKQAFTVDVSGVEVLELRVYAENGNNFGSHAAWLDPYVMTK
jgi:hypothetical protein